MTSREPNSLRLPATSSSKLSGASTLTIEVSVCGPAGQRFEARALERRRSLEYLQRGRKRQRRAQLRPRGDSRIGCRPARSGDQQLASLGFDDYRGLSR